MTEGHNVSYRVPSKRNGKGTCSRPDPKETDSSPRVLFVDDEKMIRKAFAGSMGTRDFVVDLADSGAEAIRRAQQTKYPVIVTDLRMPGMDGLALISHLRPLCPDTVFVILTGMPDLDLRREHSPDLAIESIVSKPWDNDSLAKTLHRAIRSAKNRRPPPGVRSDANSSGVQVLLLEKSCGDADLFRAHFDGRTEEQQITQVDRLSHALEALRDHSYDAIFTELSLPDATGLDAVIRLHAAAPDTAIIVLSGCDDDELAVQAVGHGAQDFLNKSTTDSATLQRSLRYALERKRVQQQLIYLAHHDPLTGLVNRVTLRENMLRALARSRRFDSSFSLMFLDLDRFKPINDTLGHGVGDALLREISDRLRRQTRNYDTVARLGGDEFAVLLDTVDDSRSPPAVAQRIVDSVSQPVLIDGHELVVTTSVGIATFPEAGNTVEDLLKRADTAMYEAKQRGRNRFMIYCPDAEPQALPRLQLQTNLRDGLTRGDFSLHYQPQIDVHSKRAVSMEALLRWARPGAAPLSPAEFVPLLEDSGQILAVGEWVLQTACEQLRSWRSQGLGDLRVAVNLSSRQLEQEGLLEVVHRALDRNGLPADALELEITEELLMRDTARTNAHLLQLKAMRVRIVVDDFGTGYSSVAYLRRFGVDTIKIDQAFIGGTTLSDDDDAIVNAIIKLGHSLDLDIVAEGVETPRQLAFLRSKGCDIVQGFLLGRPSVKWSTDHPGSSDSVLLMMPASPPASRDEPRSAGSGPACTLCARHARAAS